MFMVLRQVPEKARCRQCSFFFPAGRQLDEVAHG
jgi:hypothetical protein